MQRAQGLIPGQGTKIPKAAWQGQKKEKIPRESKEDKEKQI